MNKLIVAILFVLTILVFKDLTHTFYQQDEWNAAGAIKSQGFHSIFAGSSFVDILTFENRPLAKLLNLVFFGKFAMNIYPLFIFVITFHVLNSFFTYKIIENFVKKKYIAILSTLFFTFNGTSRQAVLWFGTVTSSLPSTFGILASIFFYLNYLKDRKGKYFFYSFVFLIFSLLFKETGFFLFLLFPIIDLTKNVLDNKKFKLTLHSILLLLIGLVFFIVKFVSTYRVSDVATRYIGAGTSGGFAHLLWNAITYPIESFSQILIPPEIMFPFARRITEFVFTYFETSGYAGLISEIIVVELISILISFLLIVPLILFLMHRKQKFPLFMAAILYLTSFIPYVILIKPNGYLESRYYYFAVMPIALLVGISMESFLELVKRYIHKRMIYLLINFTLFLFIGLYLCIQVINIHDQLNFLKERGSAQKYILSEIIKDHPKLEQRQVFYIEGDHSFIVPNNPLPFQNGIGYVLMVTYAYENNTDKLNPFLLDNYFWKLGNQGYLEKKGQGFGFFVDKDLLKKELIKQKLSVETIVAFRYESELNKLSNITDNVKITLCKELSAYPNVCPEKSWR